MFTLRSLYHGERARDTHWTRLGWTPQAVWTIWSNSNSWAYRESNSDPSVFHSISSYYGDCATADGFVLCSSDVWREMEQNGVIYGIYGTVPCYLATCSLGEERTKQSGIEVGDDFGCRIEIFWLWRNWILEVLTFRASAIFLGPTDSDFDGSIMPKSQ
jgi:hypothetical protein